MNQNMIIVTYIILIKILVQYCALINVFYFLPQIIGCHREEGKFNKKKVKSVQLDLDSSEVIGKLMSKRNVSIIIICVTVYTIVFLTYRIFVKGN